jgi:uncharacterized protein (TIGR01777 family)
MRFLLAGASGFLGTAWRDHLAREGHEVVRLVRGDALSANESHWDPYSGELDRDQVEKADVVANLAGAPLTHWPWTESYQRTFRASRIETTKALAEAIAGSDRKPALVAQNGIAGYGDRGAELLTETSANDADTFMGQVTRDWQGATLAAEQAGARVVVLRSGVILDKRGGALKPQLLLFKAGLGGKVGPGTQYFSTISMTDWVRAVTYLATREEARGVYNVAAPNQTTNAEFGEHLARLLRRPSVVPTPAWPIKTLAGTIASELLNSTRVEPARLLAEGFSFEHPTLDARLVAALS